MRLPALRLRRRSPASFALLAIAALGSFAVAPALRADGIDDDVKAAKAADAAGKADDAIAKIESLKATKDKRAYGAIAQLTMSKDDKIACAAIRAIVSGWQDAEFFRWLLGKVEDKAFADPSSGRPEVYKCILEMIREYPPEKVKSALKQLGDAVTRYLAGQPEYTERAIRAYATVVDRFALVQLMDWLAVAEASGPAPLKANKESAKKVLLEALKGIAGQDLPDAPAWKKWWGENSKTFKFPEPAKSGAAAAAAKPPAPIADPSKLDEFKDEAWGFSIKKPEGDEWKFFKPDYEGPRVGLLNGTEQYSNARAYFRVHDPARFAPKDVKGFVDWAVNDCFKKEFSPDGLMKGPDTKVVNLDGVDWTVVSARGLAAGWLTNWGSMERRFYIAPMGPNIFYIDAFIRWSLDDEVKDAFWKCVESVKLPAKK